MSENHYLKQFWVACDTPNSDIFLNDILKNWYSDLSRDREVNSIRLICGLCTHCMYVVKKKNEQIKDK